MFKSNTYSTAYTVRAYTAHTHKYTTTKYSVASTNAMFLYNFSTDLVAVSSTVIPLYSYHVNATGATKYHPLSLLDEEYRVAYSKLMHKKHKEAADDPDTLITCNSSNHSLLLRLMLIIFLFNLQ